MIVGLTVALLGFLLWIGFGKGWFGSLPGDINVTRGNFSFHFPVVTCLLLSILISFLLWWFRR